ncbi:MAG: hypothetical protein AAF500_19010 [Myxococcota bacterium]
MSTVQLTFGTALRTSFAVIATLVVWWTAVLQFLFVKGMVIPPAHHYSNCGLPEASFLMALVASWIIALPVLAADAVRLRRGHLSAPVLWLRVFPGVVVIALTVAALFAG